MHGSRILTNILALAMLFILFSTLPARADLTPGHLDRGFDPGNGADDDVVAVALQPDGRVLIGGYFSTVDGTTQKDIARLTANGSLETGFAPLIDGAVMSVAVQADGSLDAPAFIVGYGANAMVRAVAVQADGKGLIGGDFTTVDGTTRIRIARLNGNRTFYVSKGRAYYDMFPAFGTIQAAVNVAGDGDSVKVGQGDYDEGPVRSTAGTVAISGGYDDAFTDQTGTTEMNAPGATGGGGLRVQPNVRVIAP